MRSQSNTALRNRSAPASSGAPEGPSEAAATPTIRLEPDVDYAATAALATEAFGGAADRFAPDQMRWLYDEAFSGGSTVLAVFAGRRKVGHLALVRQAVRIGGRPETAVALVDVFLIEAFRSFATVVALYRAVESYCRQQGIRFIVSVPNDMAAPVNARILRLATAAELDIRVGVAWLPVPGCRVASHRVADLDPARGRDLLSAYCGAAQSGLDWTAERLWARLGRPRGGYALHVTGTLLLVSAPRRDRRAPHTLICALLPRPGAAVRRRDVMAATAAACRWHRRPLFVYAGLNASVPRPGLLLPPRLRPSPMILQMRDLAADGAPQAFQRFEPLDFDFA